MAVVRTIAASIQADLATTLRYTHLVLEYLRAAVKHRCGIEGPSMLLDDRRSKLMVLMCAFALVSRVAVAQSVPALAGYHLGDTWSRIGHPMPCQTDSLPPDWKTKVKHCLPSGGTIALWFVTDTLYEINYSPFADSAGSMSDARLPADVLWSRRWKRWSIARFGEPDSVSTEGTNPGRPMEVSARWRKRWGLISVVILSVSASRETPLVTITLCGDRWVTCEPSWIGLNGVAK